MPDLTHDDPVVGRVIVTFDGRILEEDQWAAVEPFVREVAAAATMSPS
jgi:hypothetical protein